LQKIDDELAALRRDRGGWFARCLLLTEEIHLIVFQRSSRGAMKEHDP
jgi:hypothetical protein